MLDPESLLCPVCKGKLIHLHCKTCVIDYPLVHDIPILINEKNSVFSFDDYKENEAYSFFGKEKQFSLIRKIIPKAGINFAAKSNYALIRSLLLKKQKMPRVLIVGGGITGKGMEDFLATPDIQFIITDVSLTKSVDLVCDCHDLPFPADFFDTVIVQAVLEHVVDPYRCVDEIHRVLKEEGIVYAETPFMHQIHGGAYDFTRFSWTGHRRLFRKFKEIKSGVCCGPGMAVVLSWKYFLSSFSKNKKIAKLLEIFALYTSFFWKYFDYYLKKKPGSLDGASGNYFIGVKKKDYLLSDKELIQLYDRKKKTIG